MTKYSCETHIDHALDMHVAETGEYPVMDFLSEDEKLSTVALTVKSRQHILYQVNNFTQYMVNAC